MANLNRLEDRADLQISIVLLASWAAISVSSNWGNWPPDLSALFMAGHLWANDMSNLIYAAPDGFFGPPVESWQTEFAGLGHPNESFFPFVYPPIWAWLAAPLAEAFGPIGFFNFFYVIHILMIATSVVLAFRIIRPTVPLALWCVLICALLLISLISTSALFHNQLQITVTFLILLSFERYRSGAYLAAGIALGLAAAIKITPAVLGIIFLLDRQVRPALATAATGLAHLGLSLAVAGPDLHGEFLHRVGEISERIAIMHVNWNIEALLFQIQAFATGSEILPDSSIANTAVLEPRWIGFFTKVFLVGAVVLVLWCTHRTADSLRLPIRLMGLTLALNLGAPLAWSHHYLTVLLLSPMILVLLRPVRAIAILAIYGGLGSLTVFSLLNNISQTVHLSAVLNTCMHIGALVFLVLTPKAIKN